MGKFFLFLVLGCLSAFPAMAQNSVVFNKTEHDFAEIGQTSVPFEHDFLFRNTGAVAVQILSVRSISNALKFIHTRSEVFTGEYGFVKVKLRTDSLSGLFHDEVYITMRFGNEVLSEVIYLRANISSSGSKDQGREFEDSRVATSVEVSAADIESLEGFSGGDKLASAEAEIGYLRKQLGIKGELISKLSEDLRKKQASEEENIQQLRALEQSIRASNGIDNENVIAQINQLSDRLIAIQKSDSALRNEIYKQEQVFTSLKHEADSARAYAQSLSSELERRFQAEAEAIEKANRLEKDLRHKQDLERAQQKRIDSLQHLIASGSSSDANIQAEIKQLKTELAVRQKEQQLQASHAQNQHQKIEQLKVDHERLVAQTDSLNQYLNSQNQENDALQTQLAETEERIANYEGVIDSLNQSASSASNNTKEIAELDSLQKALALLKNEDTQLKASIAKKDAELATLQSERQEKEKSLRDLETASNRQLEEAHKLMYHINQLSQKESQARMEVMALQTDLETSRQKEQAYKSRATDLESKLTNAHMSNEMAFSELSEDVEAMRLERDDYRTKYNEAMKEIQQLSDELAESNSAEENAKLALREFDAEKNIKSTSSAADISFKVNLIASNTKLPSPPAHPKHGSVIEYQENNRFNYAIGDLASLKEAVELKEKMKSLGYSTAHVIGFRDGKRISLKEAMETADAQ